MKMILGLFCFRFINAPALKIPALLSIFFWFNPALLAQNEADKREFPVPSGNPKQLFYLQRTENINTVIYEWNEENGNLNAASPIRIFWILYAKNGQRQNLSRMENSFAYGVNIKATAGSNYQFTLAAYPKITLNLIKSAGQKYHVYVKPLKQEMLLSRIYIKEKTGFLKLKPAVEYIEFTGTDAISGKEITERVDPED